MKNFMIFLLGAGFGAGGMFLWLHKYVKDEINTQERIDEEKESQGAEQKNTENNGEEEEKPTVNGEITGSNHSPARVDYDKVVSVYTNPSNELPNGPTTFIHDTMVNPSSLAMPRDLDGEFIDNGNQSVFEISLEEFQNDNTNEKDRLTWFRGDHVMCEENGTVITNPVMLVGSKWLDYVNHYATNTAFVRNGRLCTDYEIYVEEGLYTDEYGPLDPYEEG